MTAITAHVVLDETEQEFVVETPVNATLAQTISSLEVIKTQLNGWLTSQLLPGQDVEEAEEPEFA